MTKTKLNQDQFIKDYNQDLTMHQIAEKHDIHYVYAVTIKNRLLKQGRIKPRKGPCSDCGKEMIIYNEKHLYCKKCRKKHVKRYYRETFIIRDLRMRINGLKLMDPLAARDLLDEIEAVEGRDFRILIEGDVDKDGFMEMKI